jgi:hypothetical protein
MRRNIPIIFAILGLLSLILCSACVSQPPANQTQANQTPANQTSQKIVGLVQVSEGSPSISFDEAQQNLREYQPDPANESTDIKTIYYIHGTNLDGTGNASSWIFGVRYSGGTALLSYDRGGWIQIPWDATLISEEIDTERIVSPGRLFSQNNAVILSNPSPTNPERRDLDLIRGIYTITITSGSKDRILTFNAITGELITQQ